MSGDKTVCILTMIETNDLISDFCLIMNWINIENTEQIKAIAEQSKSIPCLIFKHSMTCNTSAMAKFRLEEDWNFNADELQPYFLDILKHRNLSNEISEYFQEYHQSPQILIIEDGFCTYEESHLEISVDDIRENWM